MKARLLAMLFVLFCMSLMIVGVSPVKAATSSCQCTKYLANRYSISGYPNAKEWNDGYLQRKGFSKVGVRSGAIVVMETSFPGSNTSFGHVGVVESYNAITGKISVRGANQSSGSSLFTENNCSNVRITSFGTSVKNRTDISFWSR